MTVTALDGRAACAEDVPAAIVPVDIAGRVWIPCRVESDGPATLLVQALGVTDLVFDEMVVVREWPH